MGLSCRSSTKDPRKFLTINNLQPTKKSVTHVTLFYSLRKFILLVDQSESASKLIGSPQSFATVIAASTPSDWKKVPVTEVLALILI